MTIIAASTLDAFSIGFGVFVGAVVMAIGIGIGHRRGWFEREDNDLLGTTWVDTAAALTVVVLYAAVLGNIALVAAWKFGAS